MSARGTLLVTGGSRGIGAAACRLAARDGWPVAVNYLANRTAADAVVRDVEAAGGQATAVQGDLGDPAAIAPLFDAAERALGPLGGLVNNAGITGPISRLDDAAPETVRKTIDLNVTGALLAAREAVQRLAPRNGGRGGAIVNLSSAAATLGSANAYVWYAASKGAIDTLTVGLAQEVAGEGIRVNGVAPGLTDTDIHAESSRAPDRVAELAPMVPMGRAATPEEVAEAVVWLLSDKASYVTGTTLRVAGGR
jgi:NAD(P)-dependent dehydrogenase (short-subunit alcohol dehydrogenase family)